MARVRAENEGIHAGNISVQTTTGTVKTQGPVGTHNDTMQTLTPPGYDHNYRAWWIEADLSGSVDIDIAAQAGYTLHHPTFRLENMNTLPASVVFDASTLLLGVDYWASLLPQGPSGNPEVWLTLLRTINATHNLVISQAVNPNLRRRIRGRYHAPVVGG